MTLLAAMLTPVSKYGVPGMPHPMVGGYHADVRQQLANRRTRQGAPKRISGRKPRSVGTSSRMAPRPVKI